MPVSYLASPNHSGRNGIAIEMIIMHATVGSYQSSLDWLRSPASKASTHYLISRAGAIVQLVADDQCAWHAGVALWQRHRDVNERSIGIELENTNSGRDPYPLAQLTSARLLCRSLIARYQIPRAGIARHLDVAIPKGRKSDPAGFPWHTFLDSLYTAPPIVPAMPAPAIAAPITADALLLHMPRATAAQCVAYLTRRPTGGYTAYDVRAIVARYYASASGIDPLLAIAQMIHETGSLTSYWSARPRRNPAGLGVTGVAGAGLHFASWDLSVAAHLGRLLAYCLPIGGGNAEQQQLIARALDIRPLSPELRGVAARLSGLNGRWAVPGNGYAEKIATIANAIRSMP